MDKSESRERAAGSSVVSVGVTLAVTGAAVATPAKREQEGEKFKLDFHSLSLSIAEDNTSLSDS